MRSLEEQDTPSGRGPLMLLAGAAIVAAAIVIWFIAGGGAPAPTPAETAAEAGEAKTTPSSANERPAPTERTSTPSPGPSSSAANAPRRRTEAPEPAPPAREPRELRVTSDVPGAYVFLNRKYLGTTPLASRDVTAGSFQLNVQLEGRPPVVQNVDIAEDGPTTVAVTLPPAAASAAAVAAIDLRVPVIHKHTVGSCEGTLRATGEGFRYETSHKDAFSLPYANVGTFSVDYTEKRLRLSQRGGRTWNFTTTAENADPLFVFHRDVEAARK